MGDQNTQKLRFRDSDIITVGALKDRQPGSVGSRFHTGSHQWQRESCGPVKWEDCSTRSERASFFSGLLYVSRIYRIVWKAEIRTKRLSNIRLQHYRYANPLCRATNKFCKILRGVFMPEFRDGVFWKQKHPWSLLTRSSFLCPARDTDKTTNLTVLQAFSSRCE
jgi:hypothetical protein